MGYEIRITPTDDFIYAHITGENSYEASRDFWQKAIRACEDNHCFKVVAEVFMHNPLGTMDIIDHPKIFQKLGINHKFKIAYIDLNPETYENTHFAETVLVNQGFSMIKLFHKITKAKKWLLSD